MFEKVKSFFAVFCLASVALPCFCGELRVVSLTPSLTETICLLGAESSLVGRSSACTYPDKVKKIPVAGRFDDPDVERIIRLAPDLVVANHVVNPGAKAMLEKASIRVITRELKNVDDYAEWVKVLGGELGKEKEAAKELARIETERRNLKKTFSCGCRVLFVIWDRPIMVAGQKSFPDEMLRLAGASNVVPESVREEYFKCSFEWVLSTETDAVVWCCDAPPEKSARIWTCLKAYQNKRFIVLTDKEKDVVLRPGPRMFDGAKLLKKKLCFEVKK